MNKKGFTLIEVLVSLSLVAVIAIFLFQIIFIIRDIYAEKSIKSELYIESSNISNVINKEIIKNDAKGNYLTQVKKINNNQVYLAYNDGSSMYIDVDKDNNIISYGTYSTRILSSAEIGNIDFSYDYEVNSLSKNGVGYIKIPISYKDFNNDFGIVIFFRYNSSKTLVTG